MPNPAIRGGGGWGPTVLVLLAAGCAGVLIVFTPPVLLIPGIILTAVFAKLRGGDAAGTLDGSVQDKDQDSGNTGATQDERCQVPSAKTTENNVLDPAAVDVTSQTSLQQVSPSLPSTASTPSRRPVEVLAFSTAKPTTSPQQPSSAVPTVASESPPPVQPTPTRSLLPETSPAPPQPSAPPQSSAPLANATKAASAKTTPTVAAPAPAPAPTAQPSPAPVAATGGLAILARLRQQRTNKSQTPASAPPPPPPKPLVTVLYGSQTGTSSEIARNLAAEAVAKGFNAKCSSLNELGFSALSPTSTPFVIVIASSTGDGDPPDNATTFFAAMRRKPEPSFAGMQFTLLGLGDSNYTRFMYVPRAIKNRLAELGANVFYRCAEADEVDGIENTVEPWMDGLWDSLKAAVDQASQTDLQVQEVNKPAAELAVKATKALDTQPEPTINAATATVAAAVAAVAAPKEAEARAAAEKQAKEVAAKEAAAKEAAAKEAAAKEAAAKEAAAKAAAKAAAEAAAEEVAEVAAETEVRAAAEVAAIVGATAAAAEAADAEDLRAAAEATVAVEAAAEATAKATQGLVEEEAPAAAAPELTSTTSQKPVPAADSETSLSAPDAPKAPEWTPAAAEQKPEATAAIPPPAEAEPTKPTPSAAPAAAVVSTSGDAEASLSTTSDEKEAAPAPVPAAEAEAPPGKDSTEPPGTSLLPGELVAVMEASVAPTTAAVGLPTIAESRVFEEPAEETDEEGAVAADQGRGGDGGGEEDPLLTPRTSVTEGSPGPSPPDGRPDSVMSVGTGRRSDGTARRSLDYGARRRTTGDKPPSRLQAKPINVNFPKREETVVKRKDEKTYGMLLGLAPVGVDTKGAPALLPCRIKLQWERDEGRAKTVREAEGSRPTREERHRLDSEGLYSASQPFWAHISDARYETAFWSDRKVLHLELSIRGSHIAYEPGDSIGVLPINHPDLVTNLCKRLNVNPERVFTLHPAGGAGEGGGQLPSHIPSPCSIGYVLSHCVDLTSVTRKSLLRLLSEHATDAAERRTLLFLSARGGKEAYAHEIGEHQPSVLDLLVRFRSCNPPFEALLDALQPLMPRMYSISSSRRDPERGPNHLSVAMSVVRFKTRYGTRLGVATTWLDRLAAPLTADTLMTPPEPIYVPIFLRRSADFKPPPDLATPLIMFGPGTGVAPFRGFLQERRAAILEKKPEPEALGEAWLFFGCRRDDEDYLYKEELQGFKAEGTLTELHVAFSRAQADKVYVQDLLKQHGDKVWGLLQAGAHVYVCGDGAAMAKDVHATLVGVVQQHGGLSAEDAASYMQSLAQDRRYIRDVWS